MGIADGMKVQWADTGRQPNPVCSRNQQGSIDWAGAAAQFRTNHDYPRRDLRL